MGSFKYQVLERSPAFIKGLLLGLHSRLSRNQKYGSHYQDEVRKLRRRAELSEDQLGLEERQLLSGFLQRVWQTNTYYASVMEKLGLGLSDIRNDPIAALLAMPLLEKDFLKANVENIQSTALRTFAVSHTSGTSGSPMDIPYDEEGYQKGFAYWRRFYDIMGLAESFRNARFSGRVLFGASASPSVFWVNDWSERRQFFSTYHMKEENLSKYIQRLNDYQPHLIDGYPSALAVLARHVQRTGQSVSFRPIAIATTAETLLDEDRKVIEAVFGAKVFNQYASSEGAPFITECVAGHLHANTDTGFFEFHDVPGNTQIKELVVTSFRNLKVPLIRYRIGDTAVPGDFRSGSCECGLNFPRIESIHGRVDDLLYSSERGAVGRLDPVYKGVIGIAKSQIVQFGLDSFRMLVVVAPGWSGDQRQLLERNFRDRLGNAVSLSIDVVGDIPMSANGKFRAVKNEWRPETERQAS